MVIHHADENNQGRQEHFDALIQFIHDAKTVGGVIDLPINTPISFSGDEFGWIFRAILYHYKWNYIRY